jgi:hypothetical protein
LQQKKSSKIPVGPVMLGFFLFVVVGSGKSKLPRHAVGCFSILDLYVSYLLLGSLLLARK